MDGVMFMHHDRMAALSKLVHRERALGAVRRVNVSFAFPGMTPDMVATNIRFNPAMEPMGCLGDLGWCGWKSEIERELLLLLCPKQTP